MKLFIQIPCYNEGGSLRQTLTGLPARLDGISEIRTVVIDDGSTDDTSAQAAAAGANFVLRNRRNLGLAQTFMKGLDFCLRNGADIIVNLDGDNQYPGGDIPRLIEPILAERADIVIGNRQTHTIAYFSPLKKFLQRAGSRLVQILSHTDVPDVTSGFRAFSREAALKLTILSSYTYTLESILQKESKGLTIAHVPIATNAPVRESRLMSSMQSYLMFSIATIIRIFTMYNPLRVFLSVGALICGAGVLLGLRFVYFYMFDAGSGKIQSLILAAILLITGATVALVGLLADLIQFNRRLLEDVLERLKRLELGE
jgi:glycosyltransferase involved in cell wall biosynthesis